MASRVENTKSNLKINIFSQVTTIILSFVSRSVFIKTLGIDYLGVNGLFTNILSVLSLAELGIGTAIVYSMYKPLSEKDERKLSALTGYFKKLYLTIALIVLGLGLAIFPFLGYIVNLDSPIQNVNYYYFLFLAESVSSYLIIYKTSIITADQKSFIINKNKMVANTLTTIIQILVLIFIRNYLLYLFIRILIPLSCNYYNTKIAEKMYPYINEKVELDKEEKKKIWVNIKSMFMYKVGDVILNNIDNILISLIVSTTVVGYYSNYSMLIVRISLFASLIFSSLQASLGNLNVNSDNKKKYFMFRTISLISFWIYGFSFIAFALLFQDFIVVWIGSEFLLPNTVVYVVISNFYLKGVLYPVWCYRQTTGLFKETKYTMPVACVINLVLSILLGNIFGIIGIFSATLIARLLTNIWFEPYKLFKGYFKRKISRYFIKEILRFISINIFIFVSLFIFDLIPVSNIYISFILKLIYCVVVPNSILLICHYKTKEFQYIYDKSGIKKITEKIKRKLRK